MRRMLLKLIILLLLALFVTNEQYCFGNDRDKKAKPNIIFLLTDDQRDNTFSIDGHPFVKTPNIDGLIKSGVRFSNTYIAEPTCAPSRVSLLTGMHERVNGVGFSSSYQLTQEQWELTYPALLQKGGYYTGFIGKFGVEYYSFKGDVASKFDYWKAHDGWARFFPKKAINCQIYSDAKENIITPIMGETMEEFLDTVPSNKPFCLSVSFSVPHGSQTRSMYPGNRQSEIMMMPANENPKLKGHPFYDKLYRDINIDIPEETATDPYRFIPERILNQQKGRATQTYIYNYNTISNTEHHIRYYQQISGLDKVIGDLLENLKKRNLDKNTIIIFASDHGLLMGEYGMGGKALLYDLTSKIPCFVYDPFLPSSQRGRKVDNLVSSLDITALIMDYAGIDKPKEMEGKSLKPLIYNEKTKWRNEIFLENLYAGRDNPFSEGIRSGDWKYIRMYDGIEPYTEKDINFENRKPDFEQLFNLKEDPAEMVNLIEKMEGTDLLNTLRKKCDKHSNKLNDRRDKYRATHESFKR